MHTFTLTRGKKKIKQPKNFKEYCLNYDIKINIHQYILQFTEAKGQILNMWNDSK